MKMRQPTKNSGKEKLRNLLVEGNLSTEENTEEKKRNLLNKKSDSKYFFDLKASVKVGSYIVGTRAKYESLTII